MHRFYTNPTSEMWNNKQLSGMCIVCFVNLCCFQLGVPNRRADFSCLCFFRNFLFRLALQQALHCPGTIYTRDDLALSYAFSSMSHSFHMTHTCPVTRLPHLFTSVWRVRVLGCFSRSLFFILMDICIYRIYIFYHKLWTW